MISEKDNTNSHQLLIPTALWGRHTFMLAEFTTEIFASSPRKAYMVEWTRESLTFLVWFSCQVKETITTKTIILIILIVVDLSHYS